MTLELRVEGWAGFGKRVYKILLLYLYALICKTGMIIVLIGYCAVMITGPTQLRGSSEVTVTSQVMCILATTYY